MSEAEAASEIEVSPPGTAGEAEEIQADEPESAPESPSPTKKPKAMSFTFSQRRAIALRIAHRVLMIFAEPRPEGSEPPSARDVGVRIGEIVSEEMHTPSDTVSNEMAQAAILSQLNFQTRAIAILCEGMLAGKLAPTEEKLAVLRALGLPVEMKERSGLVLPPGVG